MWSQKCSIPAEKFPIFRKNFRSSRQKLLTTFFFSRNSKNFLFSQNINIFTFYTFNFSLFLRKKTLSKYFLGKIGYSVFRDPFTTPYDPPATRTSSKSGGRDHQD